MCFPVVVPAIPAVDDTTERFDPVPANPQSGTWYYDLQCPDETYITRFFGRAGVYINSLTAQCGRSWNLRTIGMPAMALPEDGYYSHTSVDGFRGIAVKNHSGSLDCAQFIRMNGSMTTGIGNAETPGPSTQLACSDESRMIRIYGWSDNTVASIGIICSPGGLGLGRQALVASSSQ